MRSRLQLLPPPLRAGRLRLIALIGIGGALIGNMTAGASTGSHWNWFNGDERAHVAGSASYDDLDLHAARDINLSAAHVRIVGSDGNFEFEHASTVRTSTLNAYVAGTSKRTPITIGGWDAQDIVSLIVGGNATQKTDLQQWQAGGKTVASVTPSGALTLDGITLSMTVIDGHVQLLATLPNGSKQVLAVGTGSTREKVAARKK